ncbi:HAD family hydrolase [Candidatus Woesearchaeota archaeon]|nr:HAD family hydrolase [Candidatus Woesearchaeota archaeon]
MSYDKVKVLIFDLWGTLLENGIFPSPVRQTKKIMGLFNTPFPEFILSFERAFMTKEFKGLKEAFDNVFKKMKVNPEEYNREERLIGLWNKNKLLVKPYEDTFEVLDALKKKYKLVLLTNSPFSTSDVVEKFDMNKYFEKVYLSYETGFLKCDKEAFDIVLKDLKVKADEALMIGDSIESDMHGAANAGVKGVLIDRRGKRDYEDKAESLTDLKNKLGVK